jgi:dephospho-CoA kinase
MASGGAPRGRPLFVGLTGGIAAGKSEALAALERLGAATLSTDAVVRDLLGTPEVGRLLTERLGPDAAPAGEVDRDAVARAVFADDDAREWLEGVLWPRVGEQVARWYQEISARPDPPPAAVVEVPLLFEAGMEDVFDTTVAVVADEEVRAGRAGERGHASVDERTARQLPAEEKARRAAHVIQNDGSLEQLEAELARLLDRISGDS